MDERLKLIDGKTADFLASYLVAFREWIQLFAAIDSRTSWSWS